MQIEYLLIMVLYSCHHQNDGECDCICCIKVLMMPKIEAIQSLLQVQEHDFENFQVEEMIKVIKEICKHFENFFYQ